MEAEPAWEPSAEGKQMPPGHCSPCPPLKKAHSLPLTEQSSDKSSQDRCGSAHASHFSPKLLSDQSSSFCALLTSEVFVWAGFHSLMQKMGIKTMVRTVGSPPLLQSVLSGKLMSAVDLIKKDAL